MVCTTIVFTLGVFVLYSSPTIVVVAAAAGELYITAFKQALDRLANDELGVQAYQDYINNDLNFDETEIDGSRLVQQIASDLKDRLQTHTTMIHQLRDVIESSYETGMNDMTVPSCCNITADNLNYDVRFRAQTNLLSMCMLADAPQPFKSAIVNKMRQNLLSVPTLRWQYFGTEDNGLSFIYPATQNCNRDTFDARFRTWYSSVINQKAKNVVILMQQSASTRDGFCSGTVMSSVKEAAKSIVSTLNSQDKVAVVSFSDQVNVATVDPCYASQMSVVNPSTRKDLIDFINYRNPDNSDVSYPKAFAKAFALLNSSSSSSSNSNKTSASVDDGEDDLPTMNSPADSVIVLLTNADRIHVDINKTLDAIRDGNRPFRNKVVIIIYTFQSGGSISEISLGYLDNIVRQNHHDPNFEAATGDSTIITCGRKIRSQMTSYFTRFVNMDSDAPITYSVPYYDALGVGLIMSLCAPVVIPESSSLRGVTCVDVTIDSLFSEVQFFGQSLTSYAFLIDGYGRLLLHPLLPQPQSYSQDAPPLADLTSIEYDYDDNILQLRLGMLTNLSGSMVLKPRKIYRRGESEMKGVNSDLQTSTYYWHRVNGTNFSVCVVISAGEKNIAVKWSDTAFPRVLLLDDDVINNTNISRCNHYGLFGMEDLTVVRLAPSMFFQPSNYLDLPVNHTVVQSWRDYLEGRTSTSTYIKPGIRDAIASTYKLQEIWQQRNACPFAIWRYIGLKEGVFRKTPVTDTPLGYDPTRRPWYQQAVADGTGYSIYGPYTDVPKTGCILSLAKSVTRSSLSGSQVILGVMAIDFTLKYFNGILEQSFPTCLLPKHECFVIDQSGFVVLHKGFIPPPNSCQYIFNQHITTLEPVVAAALIRLGILVTDNCISYVNINNLKFWKVQTTAPVINSSDSTVTVYTIPDSKIYIIDKYNLVSVDPFSVFVPSWPNYCQPASTTANTPQSEYPCYYPTEYTQRCAGQLNYNRAVPPCIPPTAKLIMSVMPESDKYYLSKLCNCNASCLAGDTCRATSAPMTLQSATTDHSGLQVEESNQLRLLGLLALLLPLAVLLAVVAVLVGRHNNNNKNNNNNNNDNKRDSTSSTANMNGNNIPITGLGLPGLVDDPFRCSDIDYDYIAHATVSQGTYITLGREGSNSPDLENSRPSTAASEIMDSASADGGSQIIAAPRWCRHCHPLPPLDYGSVGSIGSAAAAAAAERGSEGVSDDMFYATRSIPTVPSSPTGSGVAMIGFLDGPVSHV